MMSGGVGIQIHPEAPRRASKDEAGMPGTVQGAALRRVLRGFGLWPTRLRIRSAGGCRGLVPSSPGPWSLPMQGVNRHRAPAASSDLREKYPFHASKRPPLLQCNPPL